MHPCNAYIRDGFSSNSFPSVFQFLLPSFSFFFCSTQRFHRPRSPLSSSSFLSSSELSRLLNKWRPNPPWPPAAAVLTPTWILPPAVVNQDIGEKITRFPKCQSLCPAPGTTSYINYRKSLFYWRVRSLIVLNFGIARQISWNTFEIPTLLL